MSLGIVIVSFNTKDLLEKSLKNIHSQTLDFPLEIVVIDNNSSDNSLQMVREKFPKVKIIANIDNLGFAKAVNQGVKVLSTDYILLLNPDTSIPEGAINEMVAFMQENPKCQIGSCVLTDVNGKLKPNGGDLPVGFPLLSWLFNLEFLGSLPNFHRLDSGYYAEAREVGWVGGTFMMVRKESIGNSNLLDEKYFMYFEDVDLCFRTRKSGQKIMINPKIKISHIGGASSNDPRLTQWKGEIKGLLIFYKKYFGDLSSILVKLLVYISISLRVLAFALIGKISVSKTYGKIIFSI